MGPLGIKKAEQDLIRRRYKQYYNNSPGLNYVASEPALPSSSLLQL